MEINQTSITHILNSLSTLDGIGIYKICKAMGIKNDRANANVISAILRKMDYTKDHNLTKTEDGVRVYLWFPPKAKEEDWKDAKIQELKLTIEELEKIIKGYQAKEVIKENDAFFRAFQEPEAIPEPLKVSEPVIEQPKEIEAPEAIPEPLSNLEQAMELKILRCKAIEKSKKNNISEGEKEKYVNTASIILKQINKLGYTVDKMSNISNLN